jgi:hypothetical protein
MNKVYFSLIILLLLTSCKSHKATQKTSSATPSTTNTTSKSASNKEIQLIHLPVFIPTDQLQKQLYDNFFAPNYGKYYPCEGKSDCSDLYKDLYIENPVLKVKGEYMTIQLHLAGKAKVLVFHPDISGDITLTAKPMVRNDTLFFDKVTMEKSSQSFLLKVASTFFEKSITKKIQDNAWYSFRPTLDKYTAQYQKQMPLKWESSVLLLSLKKIYLNKVSMIQPPGDGIIADFSAELTTEDSSYGQ